MHADAADRIVVATALYLGAAVITLDERIPNSGIAKCIG
jgi:PIN domain nuclease of toxin-antitoxin system